MAIKPDPTLAKAFQKERRRLRKRRKATALRQRHKGQARVFPENQSVEQVASALPDGQSAFGPSPRFDVTPEIMKAALQRGELIYHVQPICCARSCQPIGFEALVRWRRSDGLLLGPEQFLGAFAQALSDGAQPPLKAAQRIATWAIQTQNKFITFNIEAAFLDRTAREGLGWLRSLVDGLPREKICFELVETILDDRPDQMIEVTQLLQEHGHPIALDDFGVGHSSLKRLQDVPVDLVKIDRRFIAAARRGMRDREVLSAMLEMTRALGARSVVEGIEDPNDLALAQRLGADCLQGYYLGRPMPPDYYGSRHFLNQPNPDALQSL